MLGYLVNEVTSHYHIKFFVYMELDTIAQMSHHLYMCTCMAPITHC